MSQSALGDSLSITFQQVQKYEKGTNRISASRLQQISNILQAPVSFFFEGAPEKIDGKSHFSECLPSHISEFLATSDGLALASSFARIKNAKLRRCIVNLVEDIAGA